MKIHRLFIFAGILTAALTAAADSGALDSAQKAGVKKCLPAVKKFTEFLTKGASSSGASSTWATNNTDKQLFATTIEANFGDGVILSRLVVAPVQSSVCAATYSQVTFHEKTCMATRDELFKKWEYKGEVNERITLVESPDGSDASLMSVKGGCVVVKTETIFNAN